MSDPSFSVTEVVTATRCPRQFVLARRGARVVPYGSDAFGNAAHAALRAIAVGAVEDAALAEILSQPMPDRTAVERSLFRLALGEARNYAKQVAKLVDGSELAAFADTVRHIAGLLTPPVAKACASRSGRDAAASVFLGAEESVEVVLGGVTIRGRIDLLCRDGADTWVWDLKTYAGTDLAQLEQVRLYAMAYAAKGKVARPALLHVVRDRLQFSWADPPRPGDAKKLETLTQHMISWAEGATPPAAPDLATCRKCPAQSTCWREWGRTLADEVEDPPARHEEPKADVIPRDANGSESETVSPPLPPTATPAPSPAPGWAAAPGLDPKPMWIGADQTRKSVLVDPMEIVRHVAVFGAAGSGKTVLAKTLVEEAVLAGIPVLAFDVQGDILQLAKPLEDNAVDGALRSRRDAYRERADVRLLTPMSDAGLRISLNPLRFPSRDMPPEEGAVYSEAVAENLLAHVKLPTSWRDHARAYLAARVRDAMKKVPSLLIEDLIAGITADEDVDDPLLDRTQRARLANGLRLLTVGSKSYLFRVGRPLDLEALLDTSNPNKTPLNILWLNGLGDHEHKASFVAMVLADLYGWMLRQRGGGPRVLLYFDEIGPYMPPHGEPPSKKLLKRIFKEGRKYGVCGLFATQNFTDVDYKVVSQASTIAIGRLNAAQEKKKAADALGSPPNFDVNAAVDKLVGSNPGRFIVKRVEGSPHWLQGRDLVTFHKGTWGEEEIRAHTPQASRESWKETMAEKSPS